MSRAPREIVGTLLETPGWADYALLDFGGGEKLERYGGITLVRPEAQALGARRLPPAAWERADAAFTGDVEEEGPGRWRFPRPLGESWEMAYEGVTFIGRFTSFRHVGVFPEQEAHWRWAAGRIANAGRRAKLLNLFGYTGLASLTAAAAGAEVTHVDASKKAIAWARENQARSGMDALPIRWICEDAGKFVAREGRRGSRYDAIVLDPPKFGRGPGGEVFDLFRHLPDMLRACVGLLSERPLFLILTAYAIRTSFVAIHELMAEALAGHRGTLESGELLLREHDRGRRLSTSLFSRWSIA